MGRSWRRCTPRSAPISRHVRGLGGSRGAPLLPRCGAAAGGAARQARGQGPQSCPGGALAAPRPSCNRPACRGSGRARQAVTPRPTPSAAPPAPAAPSAAAPSRTPAVAMHSPVSPPCVPPPFAEIIDSIKEATGASEDDISASEAPPSGPGRAASATPALLHAAAPDAAACGERHTASGRRSHAHYQRCRRALAACPPHIMPTVPAHAMLTPPAPPAPPFLVFLAVLAECNYDVNEATSRLIDSE